MIVDREQLADLAKDIRASGVELITFDKTLVTTLEQYGHEVLADSQCDKIVHIWNTCCGMNKEWITDGRWHAAREFPVEEAAYKNCFAASQPAADTVGIYGRIGLQYTKGKYKGEPVTEVAKKDPSYVVWSVESGMLVLPNTPEGRALADQVAKVASLLSNSKRRN